MNLEPSPQPSGSSAYSNQSAENLIPRPVSIQTGAGFYTLSAGTVIRIVSANSDGLGAVLEIAHFLAERLRTSTGFSLPVVVADDKPISAEILLKLDGSIALPSAEGYRLGIEPGRVELSAGQPAGLFYAVQTLRQLFPPAVESAAPAAAKWILPVVTIEDSPRFEWRGAMLDVARHFFRVEDVKHYIDLLAYYKINRLHLHLTDDQGWRLMIESWPNLALHGGKSSVNGDPGGYYTQADYREIVAYAQSRFITIVPEIDVPGHTHAALASYASLNCSGTVPKLYTGTEVGFSSLCLEKLVTYHFIEDVVRELAALTPGPYIHMGGDEAKATRHEDYVSFIGRVQQIVTSHGKQMVGWEEIANTALLPSSIAQAWNYDAVLGAAAQGAKVILSPACKTYLDMKYDPDTCLGLFWAGYVPVPDSYNWDPATYIDGLAEESILGVEAPIWSETLITRADLETMALPRLPGIAEIGWSPSAGRSWDEYKFRLASHAPRWSAMGVNYYPAEQVPWSDKP